MRALKHTKPEKVTKLQTCENDTGNQTHHTVHTRNFKSSCFGFNPMTKFSTSFPAET